MSRQCSYPFAINYFFPIVYFLSVLWGRKRLRRQVGSFASISSALRDEEKNAEKGGGREKEEEEEEGEGERTRHTLP